MDQRMLRLLAMLSSVAPFCAPTPVRAADRVPLGQTVDHLEFKDIRYLNRDLNDLGKKRAFVFVASDTTCPLVGRYLPILQAMEAQYRDRGVQFVALNVGPDDSITEMAAQAVEAGVTFPFCKDFEGLCARTLGLSRTPEVAVLDGQHRLRYRGRIDDQFRLGGSLPRAAHTELADALESILNGQDVLIKETPVDGCLIAAGGPVATESRPKFADVARILRTHCQRCHNNDRDAPFPLFSFRDVAVRAPTIAEVIEDRRMPPWYASDRHGEFVNHRGLSASERETIRQWFLAGMPKGTVAPDPSPANSTPATWRMGEPDLVVTMPIAHEIPATGFVDYRYAVLPHVFLEDTWVQAVEIMPDNRSVVHHANLAFAKVGEGVRGENFVTGRVPGGDPMMLDSGVAYLIPKGSVLGLQIHYTTTGKPERAKLAVGLRFPREPVQKRLYHKQVHTNSFRIPPHASAHEVKASRKLDFAATGVGLFSHMHVRGKDMAFLARYPNGTTETLLLIPNYNFDWQHSYRWAPGTKKFPAGTVFEVVAHFDNSDFNPYNPDPKATVTVGDQTYQEMVYGFYFFTRDDEQLDLRIDPKSGRALSMKDGKS